MLGFNGGLMGVRKVPTSGAAPGMWSPNEQSVAKRAGIWPQVQELDPYFANVSLLLHMDGSNGSTTFTDSSGNGLVVRAGSNAQISTVQSKFGTGSCFFDGSNDYLAVANDPALDFGSDDFTIEGWVYTSTTQHSGMSIYTKRPDGSVVPPLLVGLLSVGGSNRLFFWGSTNGSNWNINGSFTPGSLVVPNDEWVHIAVVRNGEQITSYVDGVADTIVSGVTGSLVSNTSEAVLGLGSLSGGLDFSGHIDEFRITQGISRYNATFTPPTAPFPNA